jgi:hypothetical protein
LIDETTVNKDTIESSIETIQMEVDIFCLLNVEQLTVSGLIKKHRIQFFVHEVKHLFFFKLTIESQNMNDVHLFHVHFY